MPGDVTIEDASLSPDAPGEAKSGVRPSDDIHILVQRSVPMTTGDGLVLRADVYRPAGPGPFPVALLRTPYDKTMFGNMMLLPLAQQGFIAVAQDARNRFSSDGEGDPHFWVDDASDGAEAIAWAAALPDSSGDVVMVGASFGGWNQWAAASRAPAALRAISPTVAIGGPYEGFVYRGGVFAMGMLSWMAGQSVDIVMRRHKNDPAVMQQKLGGFLAEAMDLEAVVQALPLDAGILGRHGLGYIVAELLDRSGPPGPMIQAMLEAQDVARSTVPAYVVTGWFDYSLAGDMAHFTRLRESGGSEAARTRSRLIVGPWAHGVISFVLGDRNFGMMSGRIDSSLIEIEQVAWLKSIVAGTDEGGAPVKIFVMGANVWRDEQEWPLARVQEKSLYLSSGGNANTLNGDGVLSDAPGKSRADSYRYDPADPVPTHGGTDIPMIVVSGPSDQRGIEARQDVLCYTSEILEEDTEVTGNPVVEMWAETDAEDTDFMVRLVDVRPDGAAHFICEGLIKARFREDPLSAGPGTPVERGKPLLYRIELYPTSNVFQKGHRIRVDVTSSSFPRWARSLNIWDDRHATLAEARIAQQRILHDEEYPSRVILPIVPPTS